MAVLIQCTIAYREHIIRSHLTFSYPLFYFFKIKTRLLKTVPMLALYSKAWFDFDEYLS